MNGNAGKNAGSDSDDEDPGKLRPVNIEQDVREMERRKRVDVIMTSKLFREELERVVSDSLSGDPGLSGMLADMNVKSTSGGGGGGGGSGFRGNVQKGLGTPAEKY